MAKRKRTDPMAEAQAAVDGVAEGWRVDHAQPAQAITGAGGVVVQIKPGEYRAWKRRDGASLVEMVGDSPEQLAMRVAGWEAAQPKVASP